MTTTTRAPLSLALFALTLSLSWPTNAAAEEAKKSEPPSALGSGVSDLPAGPVKTRLIELEDKAQAQKVKAEVIAAPMQEGLGAAKRAQAARDASDEPHAALLDKLALAWASSAEALLSALRVEQDSEQAVLHASELDTKLKRAKALLTSQQARLGRLQAQVKQAETKVAGDQKAAASSEKARVEKSAAKKKRAPKPTKGTK